MAKAKAKTTPFGLCIATISPDTILMGTRVALCEHAHDGLSVRLIVVGSRVPPLLRMMR